MQACLERPFDGAPGARILAAEGLVLTTDFYNIGLAFVKDENA
jgi:hypothetical protein